MKNKFAFFSLAIVSLCGLLAVSGCLSAVSESSNSTETEFDGKFTIAYSNNVEGYLEPCG